MHSGKACTDFKLEAQDGTRLITRSMEFAQDLQSNLRSSPRGRLFNSTVSKDLAGFSWKAHYGYLYVDGFGVDASFDGMNETGLTFEYLYLPNETAYQTTNSSNQSKALSYILFGDWVLSHFQTIEEVQAALSSIDVISEKVPQLGNAILPAHAAIHDASGKGIVVEFYNNKINVYKNIGIMTNSPKYDWHVNNLANYLNLSANNPSPLTQDGITYMATGQGSGAVGLPGDASPPSRFVKIAFMVNNVFKVANAESLLNMAQHIINNVDLPAGLVREGNSTVTDTTQWVVFKDMTHKRFYYRTYNNLTLRMIDLGQIDFSEKGALLKMPLTTGTFDPIDMSTTFNHSASTQVD